MSAINQTVPSLLISHPDASQHSPLGNHVVSLPTNLSPQAGTQHAQSFDSLFAEALKKGLLPKPEAWAFKNTFLPLTEHGEGSYGPLPSAVEDQHPVV